MQRGLKADDKGTNILHLYSVDSPSMHFEDHNFCPAKSSVVSELPPLTSLSEGFFLVGILARVEALALSEVGASHGFDREGSHRFSCPCSGLVLSVAAVCGLVGFMIFLVSVGQE